MSTIFFINNRKTINESKDIDGTQCNACSTTEASIFIDNKVVMKLSCHDVWIAVWFISSSLKSKGKTCSSGFRVSPKGIFLKKRSVYWPLLYEIHFGIEMKILKLVIKKYHIRTPLCFRWNENDCQT